MIKIFCLWLKMLPELMSQILMTLDIKDIENYCYTAKYHVICYDKQFWMDK